MKVISGDQQTLPILIWFYQTVNKELVLIINLKDYAVDVIRIFGVFELRLLHPNYIQFLSRQKFQGA